MVNHYRLGTKTGIEQGYEAPGNIPDANDGYGLNIQYANTAFGQGMTATPLQMGAALSSIVNGGTYYKPHLVEGNEQVVKTNVVKAEVTDAIRQYMEYTIEKNNRPALRAGYRVGGKTGTAQIAKPGGGYYEDRFNGMYIGYVGGKDVDYVIVVRVNEPKIAGYAGAKAAAPVFADISNMLINAFGVEP
jgi:stage V sporulation protein D (sporulation-specific penicillin-binding protein)